MTDGTGVVLGIPTKYWASLNAINSKAIIKGPRCSYAHTARKR